MLLRHTLAVSAAGEIRVAADDNLLMVCNIAGGTASAFDVGEEASSGELLRPLATVELFPAAAAGQVLMLSQMKPDQVGTVITADKVLRPASQVPCRQTQ